jgi:hypothetical protein
MREKESEDGEETKMVQSDQDVTGLFFAHSSVKSFVRQLHASSHSLLAYVISCCALTKMVQSDQDVTSLLFPLDPGRVDVVLEELDELPGRKTGNPSSALRTLLEQARDRRTMLRYVFGGALWRVDVVLEELDELPDEWLREEPIRNWSARDNQAIRA